MYAEVQKRVRKRIPRSILWHRICPRPGCQKEAAAANTGCCFIISMLSRFALWDLKVGRCTATERGARATHIHNTLDLW